MREYIIKIEKNKIISEGIQLVQNDYNSTKLIFDFDVLDDCRKVFQLKFPSGNTWVKEIEQNELILVADEEGEQSPVLIENGLYEFDIAMYNENSKLTTTDKALLTVRKQIEGPNAELDDRVPILDGLINETTKVVNEANNLDIDIKTTGTATTVEITRKDGSKKSATVSGEGGDGVVEESDPTVPEHVKNISQEDIENWNSGGKIGSISVNGVEQSIEDKNVDLKIPMTNTNNGIGINVQNYLHIVRASDTEIKAKTNTFKPIVPSSVDYAVKMGLVNSKLTWTETEKASARTLLGVTGLIADLETSINEQIGNIETLLGGI